MNFLEQQQKAKESIIEPICLMFELKRDQVTVSLDNASLISVIIHTTPTITYHFAYNMQLNDLQCVMLGAALSENPLSLTAVPVSISLSILQQIRDVIVKALDIAPETDQSTSAPKVIQAEIKEKKTIKESN